MRLSALPRVDTKTSYARLTGGLDLVSPPLTIDPGKCISAMNYECNSLGGYRRIDGYERMDGRPSPSAQVYYYCDAAFTGTVAIGDIVKGETSNVTGKVIEVSDSILILTRVEGAAVTFTDSGDLVTLAGHNLNNGDTVAFSTVNTTTGITLGLLYYVINKTSNTFQLATTAGGAAIALTTNGTGVLIRSLQKESFSVGGVVKGEFLSVPLENGYATGVGHATAKHLTANEYRQDIRKVGEQDNSASGLIRGVCMLKGVTYAFRNNLDGSAVNIYKATTSGWQKITLFKSLPYKNGTMDIIDGVVINQSQSNPITAGGFIIGRQYIIESLGTTNFTTIGATANTLGLMFVATGVGSGTGTASQIASAMVKRQVIETEFNQTDLDSTSITSVIIGTGLKSVTVEKGKAYKTADSVIITSFYNPLNYMIGTVSSYDGATGVLIASISSVVGSGTFANWIVHAETTDAMNIAGRLILSNIVGTFTDNPEDKIRFGYINTALIDGIVQPTYTSATSVSISTGSKTFTIALNLSISAGQAVKIVSTANVNNYMIGSVTSYNSGTGSLVASINVISGSGTFSDFYVKLVSDPVSQINILPGGNYQFILNNFLASADTKKIYGTDSLNRAFEFDGDVYIPIKTQMLDDSPTHIAVVNNTGDTQLVLSYFGQLLFSAIGNPHNFKTTSLGFQDLGIGDTITGMSTQVGGVLAVFCRDSCWQSTIDTQTGLWTSALISSELGAIHYGVLNLGGMYSFDDKGIVKIVPSYVFGGFEHDTVSRAIQPVIDEFREKIVATAAFKNKNQCRFYARDGSGICMTMAQGGNGVEHYFTQFRLPIAVSYAWHGEDASGRDVVLLGDEQGYVYVCNRGSSFDGEEVTAFLRTAFNNLKAPSAIKRFRKMEVEMTAVGYSKLRFYPDFSYADPDVATHRINYEEIQGSGGYWDESMFNTFYYDGNIVSQPQMRISGSGINIGLVVFSQSAIDFGHTLSGIILHYTPRKLNR